MDEIVTRASNIHNVSAYLLSFDAPAPAPFQAVEPEEFCEPEPLHFFGETAPLADVVEPEPPIDVEALRRDFEAEMADALQKQAAAHEEALSNARAQWIEQQAEALARRIDENIAMAFESLRMDVSRILSPFVSREIQSEALKELIDATRQALEDETSPAIRLSGPKDLIEKIAQAIAAEPVAVTLAETDEVDVTVDLGLTKIETRLDAWMRRLCESRSQT